MLANFQKLTTGHSIVSRDYPLPTIITQDNVLLLQLSIQLIRRKTVKTDDVGWSLGEESGPIPEES